LFPILNEETALEIGKTDVDVVRVIDRVTSAINPGWPLKSTGSSIKIKGAKTILSKKHCRSRLPEGEKG
jgi:hypothetical protein